MAPAWLAFWLVEAFFVLSAGWKIENHALTHAGGVVICDRKTPIRQAVAMAHDLADRAKWVRNSDSPVNAVQIEVFESADLPEGRLDEHRKALYPDLEKRLAADGALTAAFTLSGDTFPQFVDRFQKFKEDGDLPRSKIYDLLAEAVREKAFGRTDEDDKLKNEFLDYLKTMGRSTQIADDLDTLWGDTGTDRPFSLQLALLAQYWDYVDPFDSKELPPARFLATEAKP